MAASDTPAEGETDSQFLDGLEFLTGEDPNLGSFLLVVGMVTCVFVALFQFTLSPPISHLLTAGVFFVTVLSAVFAGILDSLGYFDRATAETATEETTRGRRPWVPVDTVPVPLPPLLNFDDELRAFSELEGGSLPPAFDPFVSEYLRLKTNTGSRTSIASDLRADLNPIGARYDEGDEGYALYEEVAERLFRYISNSAEHVGLESVTFYDDAGTESTVADLGGQLGSVELTAHNEGEAADVEITVEFRGANGGAVASRTVDAGTISPGAKRTLTADVFVPGGAKSAATTIRTTRSEGSGRRKASPPGDED